MTISLKALGAVFYLSRELSLQDGMVQEEEADRLLDFFGTFREMDESILQKIIAYADEMDDGQAQALIGGMDDDARKQIGELLLKVLSADGSVSEEEAERFHQIKDACKLPVDDAVPFVISDPDDGGETEEVADDSIVPAFLVVNCRGVGTMRQCADEDWSVLGIELASWIGAKRVEVVRYTTPLNAVSEKLDLLNRHVVFMVARGGYDDETVGDNMPATILYNGGYPLYGDIVFALETDDYHIEGFHTLGLFNEAMQKINDAVDGLIQLPVVTLGTEEGDTGEPAAETWPDEADGVPYNMDWEDIRVRYDEDEQALGLAALHGDAASLRKYAKLYQDDEYYYDALLDIQEDDSDEVKAACQDGFAHFMDDEYEEAFPLLMKAAKRGNTDAMYLLGRCWFRFWEYGDGSEDECWPKAFEWFLKAAVAWHPRACYDLGEAFYYGRVPGEDGSIGSHEDYEAAAFWFSQGVKLGNADSANFLSGMYQEGEGVEKDESKALELLWKAHELDPDNYLVWYNIGLVYEQGKGVPASVDEALKWYWKAKDKYFEAKARYAILLYNRHPGDKTAITLLKEAAEDCSLTARAALDQLGIKY